MWAPDDPIIGELAHVKAERYRELLSKANVVGLGLGNKIVGGEDTGSLSIAVFVRLKVEDSLLGADDRIPKTLSRRPTDVVEIGDVFASDGGVSPRREHDADGLQMYGARRRPVPGGVSGSHFGVSLGTLGGSCYQIGEVPGLSSRWFVLGTNHVLADGNRARLGDSVLQPSPRDGGTVPRDIIGELSHFVPVRYDGSPNHIDAAIAEVSFNSIDRSISQIGYLSSVFKPAQIGLTVKKTGRATGFTTGQVVYVDCTLPVNYRSGMNAVFDGQIVTTRMTAPGDSGSLLVDTDNNPIGLLFAHSLKVSVANPIGPVQAALGVRLWP